MNRFQLKRVDDALMDWAEYEDRESMISTRLGYPSMSTEAQMLACGGVRSGRPAGSIDIEVNRSKMVALVHKIYLSLPDILSDIIYIRYRDDPTGKRWGVPLGQSVSEQHKCNLWCETTNRKPAEFYYNLRKARLIVLGRCIECPRTRRDKNPLCTN